MKKLICGLMAGIMALSLMACGQSSASAQTEGSTAEDKTQVETASKETEKAEEVQLRVCSETVQRCRHLAARLSYFFTKTFS